MDLHFIGRGSAFHVKEKNTSAYFIEKDSLFLIDCGETVFSTLMEKDILSQVKNIYVLISHTHSDHCGSLGSLGFYCQYVLGTKLKIIVPHHQDYIQSLKTLMSLYGNTSEAYEFIYEESVDHMFDQFLNVRYDLTVHDDGLICFSFIFETLKGAIFYSADTRVVDNVVAFMNRYQTIDRIYIEATDVKIVGDVHLYMYELKKVIPDEMCSKIYMMHLRSDSCMDLAKSFGFQIVECE